MSPSKTNHKINFLTLNTQALHKLQWWALYGFQLLFLHFLHFFGVRTVEGAYSSSGKNPGSVIDALMNDTNANVNQRL